MSKYVCGVELDESVVQLATKKLKEQGIEDMPTLLIYDGVDLPFKDEAFDFIYSCFVIQHMSKENAHKLMISSLKKLKVDGRILFEFFGSPCYLAEEGKNAYSGDLKIKDGAMYNNAYSKDGIKRLLEKVKEVCPCSIDWIEEWPVETAGAGKFNNYWVCIKREV